MALNLHQLLSVGRQVVRAVRQVQRMTGTPGPDGGRARSRGRGHDQPHGRSQGRSHGRDADPDRVTDYPGDFHGTARVEYSPTPGPQAGPGEVVWTWVPFEELDGRGKDRPVLVVGRNGGYLLALQLTSRDRNNAAQHDPDYIDIGTGAWDRQGRPSEVKLDRILQVQPRDVRREGGMVDEHTFRAVAAGLRDRNGWS